MGTCGSRNSKVFLFVSLSSSLTPLPPSLPCLLYLPPSLISLLSPSFPTSLSLYPPLSFSSLLPLPSLSLSPLTSSYLQGFPMPTLSSVTSMWCLKTLRRQCRHSRLLYPWIQDTTMHGVYVYSVCVHMYDTQCAFSVMLGWFVTISGVNG